MKNNLYFKLLFLEIILILIVGLLFYSLSSTKLAGQIAGSLFVFIGLFIFTILITQKRFQTLTSYMCLTHLCISIIILAYRYFNPGISFAEISYWGITGGHLHKLGTFIYFLLMLSTLFEGIKFNTNKGL